MPPGIARLSNRAAMLTPSPYSRSPSTITSPKLMPMRNCIWRCSGSSCILHLECVLNLDGTAHGIHHTGELGQQVVAGGIDHTATVLLNQGRNDRTIGGEGADGGFFIVAHETAVPRHIGAEDRRQLAFHADCRRLVRQRCSLLTVNSNPYRITEGQKKKELRVFGKLRKNVHVRVVLIIQSAEAFEAVPLSNVLGCGDTSPLMSATLPVHPQRPLDHVSPRRVPGHATEKYDGESSLCALDNTHCINDSSSLLSLTASLNPTRAPLSDSL